MNMVQPVVFSQLIIFYMLEVLITNITKLVVCIQHSTIVILSK